MPGDNIIGRVSVKVVPDTSKFREELKAELTKELRGFTQEVKVTVDLDAASVQKLKTDARRAVREAQAAAGDIKVKVELDFDRNLLQNALDSIDDRTVNVRVDVDDLELRALVERLDLLDDRSVRVRVDTADAQQDLDDLTRELADLQRNPTTVLLRLNDTAARRDIRDFRTDVDPIRVDVRTEYNNAAGAATSSRLAVLARPREAEIIPTINQAAYARVSAALAALSGARVLGDTLRSFREFMSEIDRAVPLIGSLSLAVAGLSGFLLSAASNMFALATALAQIGPAVLLVPGIFTGIGIALGTMIAAFKDFNTIFPKFKSRLTELRKLISKNFWDGATEPFRQLIDDMFPRFEAGLGRVATSLGGFFANIADSLREILGPRLGEMFDNLAESIDVAAKYTDSFVSVITKLGLIGSEYLPRLAEFVGRLLERFDAFLGGSGLGRLIDNALVAIRTLASAFADFFGIINGIGQAALAAGGSSLGVFADTLNRIHAIVDSPAFQSALTNAFRGAHEMMSAIATVSGPAVKEMFAALGQFLAQLGGEIGVTIGLIVRTIAEFVGSAAVLNGVAALFSGIQVAVAALQPAIAPLAQAFGALGPIMGSLAVAIAQVLTTALVPLSQAFTALAPIITPLIQMLGTAFVSILQTLTPLIAALAPVIGQVLVQAMNALAVVMPPIITAFQTFVNALLPAMAPLMQALAPVIPLIARAFADVLTAVTPLIPLFVQLVATILPPLVQLFLQIVNFVLPFLVRGFEALRPVIPAVANVISALVTEITKFIPPSDELASRTLPALGQKIADILNWVAQSIPKWGEFARTIASDVVPKIETFATTLRDKVASALDAAGLSAEDFRRRVDESLTGVEQDMTEHESAFDKFKAKLSDPSNPLGAVFLEMKRHFTEVWEYLQPKFADLGDAIVRLVEAWKPFAPIFDELSKILLGGLVDGITSFVDGIAGLLETIAHGGQGALDFFQGLKALLTGDFSKAIEEFKSSFKNLAQGLVTEFEAFFDLAIAALLLVPVTKAFGAMSKIFKVDLPDLFKGAVGPVDEMAEKMLAAVTKLGDDMAEAAASLAASIVSAFTVDWAKDLLDKLKKPFEDAVDKIGELGGKIKDGFKKFFGAGGGDGGNIEQSSWHQAGSDAIAGVILGMESKQGALYETVAALGKGSHKAYTDAIRSASPSKLYAEAGVSQVEGLIVGVESKAPDLSSTMESLATETIPDPFQRADQFLKPPGQDVVGGLVAGAVSQEQVLRSTMRDLTSIQIIQAVGDLLPLLFDSGAVMIQGLIVGINSKGPELKSTLTTIKNSVPPLFSNAGTLLVSAGAAIVQGLINGIRSKMSDLNNTLKAVTASIPANKGPESVDRVLLFDAGQLIMDGFIKGLESRYAAVRKSLGSLTGMVNGMSMGGGALAIDAAMSGGTTGQLVNNTRTINYHAAPGGAQLSAEEELFAALGRARAWGW